jgi:hypothetical protein
MRLSIDEQTEHLLRKMTVDMQMDFWQSQQCAIAACDEIIDEVRYIADEEVVVLTIIYWEKVKHKLENYKK